jgi:hypothetical protein
MSKARDLAGLFNLGPRSGTTAQRPATADVGDIYYNGTTGKTEIYTTTGWKEMASGIPFGNTAGRPTAVTGQPYFNGETARLEMYTNASGWQNIVQEVPGVASITGTYSEGTNSGTITIAGTNFVSGAIASAIGTNGIEVIASSTTYNSLVQITATFTGLSNANEPYDIKVTNPSNLFGIIPDALYINASPVWQTAAGSLGTFNEQVSISVSATATDPESATITYALASGSTLPSGISLNSSNGLISGTLPDIATDTTYSFTIDATDGVNTIPRTFSITSKYAVNADYLVIAGGGGGGGNTQNGNQIMGGGGAGGYRSSWSITGGGGAAESQLQLVRNVPYTILVGSGGAGGTGDLRGSQGANSSISGSGITTITSTGGGGGASQSQSATSGGSGGGGSTFDQTGASRTTSPIQGFAGGNSASYDAGRGGGGGGAGAAGVTGNGGPGTGGAGLASDITGTSVTRAGGGGGGRCNNSTFPVPGAGGAGGGGAGTSSSGSPGISGTANTGGGGGAGYASNGGSGGSGVVILRTSSVAAATSGSPVYTNPSANVHVYQFNNDGTITF